MTHDDTYLTDLERELRGRGVDEARAGEVVAELADHLAESGEQPRDAFGDPAQYADALLAADPPTDDADPSYEAHTFRATALDEMRILSELGADGWELTGVRDFGLHARRAVPAGARATWDYARRTGVRRGPVVAQMESDGWAPCGRWLTYHYFKREAAPGR